MVISFTRRVIYEIVLTFVAPHVLPSQSKSGCLTFRESSRAHGRLWFSPWHISTTLVLYEGRQNTRVTRTTIHMFVFESNEFRFMVSTHDGRFQKASVTHHVSTAQDCKFSACSMSGVTIISRAVRESLSRGGGRRRYACQVLRDAWRPPITSCLRYRYKDSR
jgi:hypothetical protein